MKIKYRKIKRVTGYRLNGYDANYEKATFELSERYSDADEKVIEVTDLNTQTTFIFAIPK